MGNSLIDQLREFNRKERLFDSKDRILVAVSGGVDSMALLHLLNQFDCELGVAHVNFQLRAEESNLDEQLVRNVAGSFGIPVYTKCLNPLEFAEKNQVSVQMAARELRYRWFQDLLQTYGYQRLATAHHLNDALETLLLNLTKGTGISGLRGITVKRDKIIRPLLFASKEAIKDYATTNSLEWREDQSNEQDYYQRNLIRRQVIPVLQKINPRLIETTGVTIDRLKSVETEYNNQISRYREEWLVPGGRHTKLPIVCLKSVTAAVLTDVLEEFGFTYDQCKSLLDGIKRQSGRLFYSESHVLNMDREALIISPRVRVKVEEIIQSASVNELTVDENLWKLTRHDVETYQITPDSQVAALDLDQLEFPLRIRPWHNGDRFYPLGMEHQKKLSDFFVDTKVPRIHKSNILVLTSGPNIVWVVGHRIDDRYKIAEQTKKVLEIRITE